MIVAFLLGLLCGFVGSIPIAGPIAVIVFERGLAGRTREALEITVGAAFAESLYALAAFLGMTAALDELPWLLPASRVLGALILLGLGVYFAMRSGTPEHAEPATPTVARRGGPLVLGLLVTIVNPTLLATWSAVVTVLHSSAAIRIEPLDGFPFALGAGIGIVAWFAVLLGLIQKFRSKVSTKTMDQIVRVIGWILILVGIAVLGNLIRIWVKP